MKNLVDTLIGGGAVGAVEVIEQVPIPDDLMKQVFQGVIAIITLVTMLLRNRREKKDK